jgi:hypothetical protein
MTVHATLNRFSSRALTALTVASTAGVLLVAAASPSQAGNTVRDHRGSGNGGSPTVHDHRTGSGWGNGQVRDHRSKPTVRDHRKPIVTIKGPFG